MIISTANLYVQADANQMNYNRQLHVEEKQKKSESSLTIKGKCNPVCDSIFKGLSNDHAKKELDKFFNSVPCDEICTGICNQICDAI